MIIPRHAQALVQQRLEVSPAVAILGARQVGKTTLARQVERCWDGPIHHFDLEDPADLARLAEPGVVLRPLQGLVVIDEVQRAPELFPLLRVLADRTPSPARFLLLGSASPDVVRGVSESLAGRVAFVGLGGFDISEVGEASVEQLWIRGGFPRSFLAPSSAESARWRRDFVQTFVERDLPQLTTGVAGATMRRFWTMLAHHHGQVLNQSVLARALGVSESSVRNYVDNLAGTFVAKVLPPWHENVSKRQVKRPKVYVADTGLLHTLLGLETRQDVERHPVLGHSWEWFAHQQVVRAIGARPDECFFWATHAGAALDLLVVRGNHRMGFEFKRTDAPRRTRSMHAARTTLGLDTLHVIHAGSKSFPLGEGIHATALEGVLGQLPRLSGGAL